MTAAHRDPAGGRRRELPDIPWEYTSWRLIAEDLMSRIAAGHLAPRDRITLAELRAEYGVADETLRRALRHLQRDGIVRTLHGKARSSRESDRRARFRTRREARESAGARYRSDMTNAHAESSDLAAAAAEVAPGHPVTIRPVGRPALRVLDMTDWAAAELARLFMVWAPAGAVDPAAGLATGREPHEVYAVAFGELGCGFGEAEKRAIGLVRAVDQVLAELYDALGDAAELAPVVPQLRAEHVAAGRAEIVKAMRETPGIPAEWVDAAEREAEWLHAHPAGTR